MRITKDKVKLMSKLYVLNNYILIYKLNKIIVLIISGN